MSLFNLKKGSGSITRSTGGLVVSSRFKKDARLSSDFILGAIEDGVVIVDRDNIVHLFNPAASNITGWLAPEAVDQDINSVMPLVNDKGEALPPQSNPFTQALIEGHVIRESSANLLSRNGRQTAISLVVSPIIEHEDKPPEIAVGVFRDISKEKAQEAQRSDFISTASHEMRTPIAAIEGYLSLAMNEKITKIDANARNYMVKALDSTHHLGQLFQDLLTSSKADDGRLQSNPVVIEMGEIAQEVTEASRFKANEKNLNLNFVVSSDKEVSGGKIVRPLYYAFVDPTRMTEVLQNLIDNAIKYTPEGSIQVRLTGDIQTIQIQIQDTGGGIPSEDIPHLFQKFYRVDSSATRTIGGTGLGLYICRKIIELYHGRIWVESQFGKGSTFFINLPRLTSAQALDIQQRQSSVVSPSEIP